MSEQQTPQQKRPHLIRRLYNWVLHWADTPYGPIALFILAFAESSFFPIPPDVLLIALALSCRKRAFRYATICTIGSVLGGMLGYYIGHEFFGIVNQIVAFVVGKSAWYGVAHDGAIVQTFSGFQFYWYEKGSQYAGDSSIFLLVKAKYDHNAFLAVFSAAFTPIPYKVFTIAGGYFRIPFMTLVSASILGRGARFFLVSLLLYRFGPQVKLLIEKYFNLATLLLFILGVLGFLAVKYLL